MKISIITATYNSAATIAGCINSVNEQTYANIEHIIIDGASVDNTLEIINSLPNRVTKVISEPDSGIYDAINKGIRSATGDVIGLLHSNDVLAHKNIIEKIVVVFSLPSPQGKFGKGKNKEVFSFNPFADKETVAPASPSTGNRGEISGVYGNLVYIDTQNPNKVVRCWESKPFNCKNIKNGWMPPHPTLFLRKEVYQKHGLFNPSFKIAGDYDFMLRVMQDNEHNLVHLPEVITKMRFGGASTGNINQLITKSLEDIRALRNNGFRFPHLVLAAKNLRKIPQLFNLGTQN